MTSSARAFPLNALLLKQAEATLNRWIDQSGAAREQLRSLQGRAMRVDVVNTDWRVLLSALPQQVTLTSVAADVPADIVLAAGPFELAGLLRATGTQMLRAGEIEFRGSVRTAEQFALLLRLARPSLEDELAGWIGGLPARAAARSAHAAVEGIARMGRALELDTAEYLRAEARVVPLPEEVGELLSATERLRDALERLERRVGRLEARARR